MVVFTLPEKFVKVRERLFLLVSMDRDLMPPPSTSIARKDEGKEEDEKATTKISTNAATIPSARPPPTSFLQNWGLLSPFAAHVGRSAPIPTPQIDFAEDEGNDSDGNESEGESGSSAKDKALNQFPMIGGPQRVASESNPKANPRRKIPVAPGYSPMDWEALKRSGTDLRGGVTELTRFTVAELAKHNTQDDCWMALHGKVYNVTHYVRFHPGGVKQLMRGAGMDATELFMKMHSWVNYCKFLDKCIIGFLVP